MLQEHIVVVVGSLGKAGECLDLVGYTGAEAGVHPSHTGSQRGYSRQAEDSHALIAGIEPCQRSESLVSDWALKVKKLEQSAMGIMG